MPSVSVIDKKNGNGEEKIFELDLNQTLYDGIESKGHELPKGCLAGSCGSCRVEVTSGSENLNPPGVIEQNTINSLYEMMELKGEKDARQKTIRLTCRAKVAKDGKISFRTI